MEDAPEHDTRHTTIDETSVSSDSAPANTPDSAPADADGCLCAAICAALGRDPNDDSIVVCGEKENIWCMLSKTCGVVLLCFFMGWVLHSVFA